MSLDIVDQGCLVRLVRLVKIYTGNWSLCQLELIIPYVNFEQIIESDVRDLYII